MTYFKAFAKEAVFLDSSSEVASFCLCHLQIYYCLRKTTKKKKKRKKERKEKLYLNDTRSLVYRKDSSIVGTTPTPTDVVQGFALEAPN